MDFIDIIPLHLRNSVQIALKNTFGTTSINDFSLLTGGLSTAMTYKVGVKKKLYVIKLALSNINERTVSNANLSLSAAAGIAPPVYYLNNDPGISICEYIDTQPIRKIFETSELIVKLATTVKKIHNLKAGNGGQSLFDTVDDLIADFKRSPILSGPLIEECFEKYRVLKKHLKLPESDSVFSHNDLNPNNVLCDEKQIWIVDWDTAGMNDRYIDLANLANFFIHTEEQEKAYLNIYFDGNVDKQKHARFFTMRQVCRMVYALLMFKLAKHHKPVDFAHDQKVDGISLEFFFNLIEKGEISLATYEGQLMYGKALLNTALDQIRSHRWETSLAQFMNSSNYA
ncbi:hypothetical protein EOD41_19635 [Mucilaginibacter limnophilus]|uniref:Aminoglycoside phosphotransferase domain-containing protein n=1 Tax=Mucilaginibacter limnophilus TaxID=1932778 RepID=A0A3S2WVR5_9SPHI|nr:phosphotransferase [Mucilaginibacter limnophilus]RVT97218.1 hypothetical protein EOD41_19635 [Mucilaginibacter limnophilus]